MASWLFLGRKRSQKELKGVLGTVIQMLGKICCDLRDATVLSKDSSLLQRAATFSLAQRKLLAAAPKSTYSQAKLLARTAGDPVYPQLRNEMTLHRCTMQRWECNILVQY